MSPVATTAHADDGPSPPPPPIATPFDLWDPFGDPGALRRASDAWLGAADHLDRTSAHLDEMAATVARRWSGEAHDAFAAGTPSSATRSSVRKGTHELRIDWEMDGEVVATETVFVEHDRKG